MKARTILFTLALMLSALTTSAAVQSTDWRATVDRLMEQGEFKQAEKFMKSMPKKVRQQNAVTIDSLCQIMERIRKDFRITPEEGVKMIREKYPATDAQIQHWKDTRALEVMNIDGKEWWFRKSVGNLWLLGKEFKQQNDEDNYQSFLTRQKYFRQAMKSPADACGTRDWRHVNITFYLDVNADAIPAGETLRVWMPFPYENLRQKNIKLEGSNRPVTFSDPKCKHHTVYMEAVTEKGKPTHFEYTFSYDVAERHISQQDLLAMVEPYKMTEEYKLYTSTEPPHIIITDKMRNLACEIVGKEENPVLQASMIYDWIVSRFPWAGAREYSTLTNIPEYVLLNNHGDCGQVGLLDITLGRSLGIPARWESGWMLHPDEINWHDWAETYFEGVGWVPTDPSFGRSAYGTALNDYYKTGIDVYRMASNEAVGQQLSPKKTFIRSETVDFQPGEVEWKGGNLYYDHWKSHLEVNGITPVNNLIKR